jgi:hypothetical protein
LSHLCLRLAGGERLMFIVGNDGAAPLLVPSNN